MQVWQGEGYCRMTPAGQVRAREEGERQAGGQVGPQVRPPPPRSFLYTHARSSPRSPPVNTFFPASPIPMSPYSPSYLLFSSPSPSLSPTTPTSPFSSLLQGDPLTRKKLRRGERVRPHSMYSEPRSPVMEDGLGASTGSPTFMTGARVPTADVTTHTLYHPTPSAALSPVWSPGHCPPPSSAWVEQGPPTGSTSPALTARQVWSPARPVSPETRRRRRDWRRHTVVVGLSGEG